ncbi:MAG TPA: SAV_915 family protein [Pseudonocardiaceae bacterium]|nr:SAV_915 family protein [Pseudonocardiaceae bacterium]
MPEESAGPLLFVPACPVHEPGLAPYGIEVRRLADGRYECSAFSTLDRLTAAMGSYQPWVGLAAGDLVRYLDRLGVGSLYVDPELPDEAWRWQPAQVAELAGQEERR